MKTLLLAAMRCSLMFTAVAVTPLFSIQPAQAYSVTLQQIGSNVVANGTGAINLTGLIFQGTSSVAAGVNAPSGDSVVPQMNASFGAILTGQVLGGRSQDTLDSPDRRVSAPGAFFSPRLAAETLSAFRAVLAHFTCHWAMSPVLLYRAARLGTTRPSPVSA